MTPNLNRVRRATARRSRSEAEWRESIRAASEAGASLRAIAQAAGVSNPRIHQILRGK